MKKFIVILAVVFAVFIISGCVTSYNTTNTSTGGAPIVKMAEETNIVWFGLFGSHNYPLAAQVALDNDIKRVAFIDRYYKVGLFGFWIEYTTVVAGE